MAHGQSDEMRVSLLQWKEKRRLEQTIARNENKEQNDYEQMIVNILEGSSSSSYRCWFMRKKRMYS